MRKVAICGILFATAAIAATAGTARAQEASDEVDLVDGSVLKGRIAQQVPGSFVVIQTRDGRTESIPWSQVKRVSAGATPAAPVVSVAAMATPAVPTPAEQPTAAPRPPTEVHFEIGARLGYTFAAGDYLSGVSLTGPSSANGLPGVSGGVAPTLALGMRIGRYVYVGGSFTYALLSTSCLQADPGSNLTCDAHDIQAGVEAQVHIVPRAAIDPWVGFGIGHEWLTLDLSESGSTSGSMSKTLEGWNFAHVLLGVDMRVAKGVGLGPYLELTSGSFASASTKVTVSSNTQQASGDISNASSHQWVSLGIRGTYEAL